MRIYKNQILLTTMEKFFFLWQNLIFLIPKSPKLNILLFAVLIIITINGCQPAVRFASSNATGSVKSKSSSSAAEHYNPLKSYSTSQDRYSILSEAENWIGSPYKYGGNERSGVDCSGFVQQVYLMYGINLPRTAAEQYGATEPVDDSDRIPGDLLFFQKNGKINHVGIFIGGNDMIHASSSRGVIRQSLNEYAFNERYAGARRISALP